MNVAFCTVSFGGNVQVRRGKRTFLDSVCVCGGGGGGGGEGEGEMKGRKKVGNKHLKVQTIFVGMSFSD